LDNYTRNSIFEIYLLFSLLTNILQPLHHIHTPYCPHWQQHHKHTSSHKRTSLRIMWNLLMWNILILLNKSYNHIRLIISCLTISKVVRMTSWTIRLYASMIFFTLSQFDSPLDCVFHGSCGIISEYRNSQWHNTFLYFLFGSSWVKFTMLKNLYQLEIRPNFVYK